MTLHPWVDILPYDVVGSHYFVVTSEGNKGHVVRCRGKQPAEVNGALGQVKR